MLIHTLHSLQRRIFEATGLSGFQFGPVSRKATMREMARPFPVSARTVLATTPPEANFTSATSQPGAARHPGFFARRGNVYFYSARSILGIH